MLKKLRIGLLLDDMVTSAWAYRMVEIIQRSEYAEVCLLVMPAMAEKPVLKSGLINKFKRNYGGISKLIIERFLERLYRHLIARIAHRPNPEDKKNLQELLENIPKLEVLPIRTKWSDSLPSQDLETIRSHDIDVFIRLGFRILRGGILQAARYGVWSFHHGDNLVNRGGPPGFWESLESWPETGSILQILTEDLDNGQVLSRSFSCTNTMSVEGNQKNYYWKSLSFIPRKLQELHRLGKERFFSLVKTQNADPILYSRRLYTKPTNAEYAKLLLKKLYEKAKLVYKNKFYLDQWILLFDIRPTLSSSLWRYKRILPPKDRFWADPHAIERDGKYFIFIEELLYETDKGHISLIEMKKDGTYEKPVPVIERPYHLSYPFIFDYQGELYMVPESAANSTIELYKCVDFPLKWEFQKNLMEGVEAYDATLFEHEGKWWLFANMVQNEGASSWDELFVFYADSPLSCEWQSHPGNPVISDCKSSRPAGPVFTMNGRKYRPSQNSSVRYGYGFNLARIDVLNEEEYSETVVTKIEPKWASDIVATHSFARAGDLHVIDAQIRRRR